MRSHTNEINRAQSFHSDLQQGIEFVGPSGNFCREESIHTQMIVVSFSDSVALWLFKLNLIMK